MQALHGEPGPRGHPARIEQDNWDHFGIRQGRLQIRHIEEPASEFLAWVPATVANVAEYGSEHFGLLPGESQTENSLLESGRPDLRDSPSTEGSRQGPKATVERLTGPIQFILKLLDLWRLERHDAVALLGFDQSEADHVAAMLDGRVQLRGRDVRDRISHLFLIRKTLRSLFQDMEVENAWLRESHSLLDGKPPLLLLLGGSMEDLLLAKEYVDAVAGR